MAKTCIRVEACKIGSSERHNLRSKELDCIRPELTHRNEQWVERSIAEVHKDITEKYKVATGQGLQKKATPSQGGGNRDQRGHYAPAASEPSRKNWRNVLECTPFKSTPIRMKAQTYGTEGKKHGSRTIILT